MSNEWVCVLLVAFRIDSLLPVIQERLLDSISFVLAKTPYRTTRGVTPVVRPLKNAWMPSTMDISGPALTQLALNTLTNFDLRVRLTISLVKGRFISIGVVNWVFK